MNITEKKIDNISVIAVSGRIDSTTSKDLETVLNQAIDTNSKIIVNLADTDYISSSGLRVLLAGLKKLRQKKGEMRLTSLQPVVRDVFEISGLSRLFSINKTLDAAVNSLQAMQ
ncbi:MAG: STAS domain-containing protein [Methanotrichaceae archaeon]|nr:STAS domain-containing protein [Methanotrichaceae archaeon]